MRVLHREFRRELSSIHPWHPYDSNDQVNGQATSDQRESLKAIRRFMGRVAVGFHRTAKDSPYAGVVVHNKHGDRVNGRSRRGCDWNLAFGWDQPSGG